MAATRLVKVGIEDRGMFSLRPCQSFRGSSGALGRKAVVEAERAPRKAAPTSGWLSSWPIPCSSSAPFPRPSPFTGSTSLGPVAAGAAT
jgi:hypothetical protein